MSRPLHIAIDARWIFPKISGIGFYTQELIAALTECPSPHQFTLLFSNADVMARTASRTAFTRHTAFTGVLLNRGPFSAMDQVLLPVELKKRGVDVYHSTNYLMPLWTCGQVKRVVTIHDLIPLMFRDHAPRSKKNRVYPLFKWLMNSVAARSDAIIAVSESTRRDILQHMKIPPAQSEKVHVIYEGVPASYVPGRRAGAGDLTFLYVGRRDPYKNLPLLVRALAEVRKRGLQARLRVVGGDDPRYPEARREADTLGINDAIEWSGYVPDDALLSAYQQADVFVLPSRYEGFGLPVLEAMACGTPVICSRTSSLPEVAGDAALMIDPERIESLVDAMSRMIHEPELRVRLAEKGLAQAAKFTWQETARRTLAVYEHIAAHPGASA